MDERNRITLRLAPSCCRGYAAKVTGSETALADRIGPRLEQIVQSLELPPPYRDLVAHADQLPPLMNQLHWLRQRLRVPALPENPDLQPLILASRGAIGQILDRIAEVLKTVEPLTQSLLSNPSSKPDLPAIQRAAEEAACADAGAIPFQMALLLVAMSAIPEPHYLSFLMEKADGAGLIPPDHLPGIPDLKKTSSAGSLVETGHRTRIQMPHALALKFESLANQLSWSANEFANHILSARRATAAQHMVFHRAIQICMEALVWTTMALVHFQSEVMLWLKKSSCSEHHQWLQSVAPVAARHAEHITECILPVLAGATWQHSPLFLTSLEPLRSTVREQLSRQAVEAPYQPLVVYLQQLRIV